MIRSFRNIGTREVWDDERTKRATKICPPDLWKVAQRKLDQVNQAKELLDLRVPPNNRLEALKALGDETVGVLEHARRYLPLCCAD